MAGMTAYWYLTRSTGAVALLLFTASVVIGIVAIGRLSSPRWPRFAVDAAHRSVSLLAIAFLLVHIVTSVLDSFAPISLASAFIPFGGSYRPLWLGLGALSLDLMLAIAITSVLRQRVGHATWRAIHWLAYVAWPIAVIHGFGTGSDAGKTWMLAINVVCIAAVLLAVVARAMIGWPTRIRLRLGAIGGAAVFALGLAVWLPSGPLGKNWARRSGTPASLLAPASARGHA
jgi:sulfoxide reductase heme-binding subunit YedZ